MIRPCPIAVPCLDDQTNSPLANLSAEGPEPFWVPPHGEYASAVGYCCDTTMRNAWATTQEEADLALQQSLETTCPDCDDANKVCADAVCPDGRVLTTICITGSQQQANELAANAVQELCSAQTLYSATCACPDGSNSHTVSSDISTEVAQAQCEAIPLDCPKVCNEEQTCTIP